MTRSAHDVTVDCPLGGWQEARITAIIRDVGGARALARDMAAAFARMWPGAAIDEDALAGLLNARGAARRAEDLAAGGAVDRLLSALDAEGRAFLFQLAERLAEQTEFDDA